MAWMKALTVDCPVCGAVKHTACLMVRQSKFRAGGRLPVDSPHQSRIEHAQALELRSAVKTVMRKYARALS